MNSMEILEERCKSYLAEMELEPEQSDDGLYLFKYGSTVVMISLFDEDDQTFCRFASIMLKDFEPSLELLHRIPLERKSRETIEQRKLLPPRPPFLRPILLASYLAIQVGR